MPRQPFILDEHQNGYLCTILKLQSIFFCLSDAPLFCCFILGPHQTMFRGYAWLFTLVIPGRAHRTIYDGETDSGLVVYMESTRPVLPGLTLVHLMLHYWVQKKNPLSFLTTSASLILTESSLERYFYENLNQKASQWIISGDITKSLSFPGSCVLECRTH